MLVPTLGAIALLAPAVYFMLRNDPTTWGLLSLWEWLGRRLRWELLLSNGFSVLKTGEYWISVVTITLSAVVLIARLTHWKGTDSSSRFAILAAKIFGSVSLTLLWAVLLYATIETKGREPWSHLPAAREKFINAQVQSLGSDDMGRCWHPSLPEPPIEPVLVHLPTYQPLLATHEAANNAPPVKPQPTLLNLFKTDFSTIGGITDGGFDWRSPDGNPIHVDRRILTDFPGKNKFISFYIASSNHLADLCTALADIARPMALEFPAGEDVLGGDSASGMTSIKDLAFSGRVFIYHEWPLTNKQKADIVEIYGAKNLDVQFRGIDYLSPYVSEWYKNRDHK